MNKGFRYMELLAMFLIVSVVFGGCNANEGEKIKKIGTERSDNDTQIEQEDDQLVTISLVDGGMTKIYERKKENIDIKLRYPYFEKESDNINSIIEEFIVKTHLTDNAEVIDNLETDKKLTIEIDYQIVNYDSNYISIVFDGYGYVSGNAHGSTIGYAVMIDLQNESIINWNDWYDNSEQILEAVYEEKYHISYGGFKVKSHEEIYEEVKKRFKNNDDSLFFFMRNGKPCFLIGNLPNHEGGYSIIELEK